MTAPSVDTVEKPLPDRGARSLPFGGGCSLLLGLFLVAFGGVFVLAFWAAGTSSTLVTNARGARRR